MGPLSCTRGAPVHTAQESPVTDVKVVDPQEPQPPGYKNDHILCHLTSSPLSSPALKESYFLLPLPKVPLRGTVHPRSYPWSLNGGDEF